MLQLAMLVVIVAQVSGDTAAELFRRAEQLHAEGKYAEAEPLYKEALVTDGPETIPVLNALADLYHVQGRDREAEPVSRRALELGERTLPPQDLLLAASLNTLADIYRSTHRYVSAEPLYRRALAILETVLGPAHPWVGRGLANLGALRVDTQHYAEADALFKKALEISDGDSLQVAGILNNMAVCAIERGKFAAAEPYLLRSMRIHAEALKSDDPTMISQLETYALVLRKTRRTSQAKQVYARIDFLRTNRAK